MINPQVAIDLLRKQIDAAKPFLAKKQMDIDEFRGWSLLTVAILEKSFGRDSKEIELYQQTNHCEYVFESGEHPAKWSGIIAEEMVSIVAIMETYIQILELELEPRNEYWFWSILHRDIVRVCKKKFEDGHYSDSVESAMKEVNSRVKNLYQIAKGIELDGAGLMEKAFSANNPVFVFDDSGTQSAENIQLGFMKIFSGAMSGIRNPKAHANILIDKSTAIHYLVVASMLMNKLDNGKIKQCLPE